MIFEKEFINEPNEVYQNSHASSILPLPNGLLIAACFSGTKEKNLDVADVIFYKEKGSQKWTEPKVIHKSPNHSDGNTMFYLDVNGVIWFFFNTMWFGGWTMNKIRIKKSTDNGKTWSEPIWFHKPFGWLIRNKSLTLRNGEILVPCYSEVLGYKSFVLISDDNGQHWKKYGRVGGIKYPCMQPCIVQLDDESLLMYLRTAGNLGRIYMAKSYDNGRHWTKAKPTQFKNPNSGIDLHRCKSGNLVLAYNDSTSQRTPLNLALSEDEGKSWNFIKTIESNKGEYSYPYIDQADPKIIHMVHTWNRLKIQHVTFDEDWLRS